MYRENLIHIYMMKKFFSIFFQYRLNRTIQMNIFFHNIRQFHHIVICNIISYSQFRIQVTQLTLNADHMGRHI